MFSHMSDELSCAVHSSTISSAGGVNKKHTDAEYVRLQSRRRNYSHELCQLQCRVSGATSRAFFSFDKVGLYPS